MVHSCRGWVPISFGWVITLDGLKCTSLSHILLYCFASFAPALKHRFIMDWSWIHQHVHTFSLVWHCHFGPFWANQGLPDIPQQRFGQQATRTPRGFAGADAFADVLRRDPFALHAGYYLLGVPWWHCLRGGHGNLMPNKWEQHGAILSWQLNSFYGCIFLQK